MKKLLIYCHTGRGTNTEGYADIFMQIKIRTADANIITIAKPVTKLIVSKKSSYNVSDESGEKSTLLGEPVGKTYIVITEGCKVGLLGLLGFISQIPK